MSFPTRIYTALLALSWTCAFAKAWTLGPWTQLASFRGAARPLHSRQIDDLPILARGPLCMSIQKGTVKWYNPKKGFGFVIPSDGSEDIFVHQTDIQKDGFRSLSSGSRVQFDLVVDEDTGRRKAVQVTTEQSHLIPHDQQMALIHEDLMAEADEIFRELDANGDGTISMEELRSYLQVTGCSSQVIRGLFTALDSNADGAISLEEMRFAFTQYETAALFTAFGLSNDVTNKGIQEAVGTIRSEAGLDDAANEASPQALKLLADLVFDMIDVDGSGEIDPSELRQHFLSVNKENSTVSVDSILSALDVDSDGTISREEMREGVSNYSYRALKQALGL